MANYSGPKTFGIELECIAVYLRGLFDKGDKYSDVITALSLGCIAKGIRSTGHESLDDDESISGHEGDYSVWFFKDEGGLELSATEQKALATTYDDMGIDGNYEILPLEVASCMLEFSDPTWQTEIATVLSVFDELRKAGVTFVTNSTTGFHIHVGFRCRQRNPFDPFANSQRCDGDLHWLRRPSGRTLLDQQDQRECCHGRTTLQRFTGMALPVQQANRLRTQRLPLAYHNRGGFIFPTVGCTLSQ
jgi:hypothetical protein